MSDNKYWKTTITYEVLSEGATPPEYSNLRTVVDDMMTGHTAGRLRETTHTSASVVEMADALIECGYDANFLVSEEDLSTLCPPQVMLDCVLAALWVAHRFVDRAVADYKGDEGDLQHIAEQVQRELFAVRDEFIRTWNYPTARMGQAAAMKVLGDKYREAAAADPHWRGSLLADTLGHAHALIASRSNTKPHTFELTVAQHTFSAELLLASGNYLQGTSLYSFRGACPTGSTSTTSRGRRRRSRAP